MVKIFISVGMSGRQEHEVEEDLRRAEDWIFENIYKKELDSIRIVDNWDCRAPNDAGRLWCLGEAIKKLGECEFCYFVKGWQNYKGCIAEMAICKLYGITAIEET